MTFDYVDYTGAASKCRIEIDRQEGFILVTASELDGGHRLGGIRDSAEELATQVCRAFNISPQFLGWIEHNEYGGELPEEWFAVTFGFDWTKCSLSNPRRWRVTGGQATEVRQRGGAMSWATWTRRARELAEMSPENGTRDAACPGPAGEEAKVNTTWRCAARGPAAAIHTAAQEGGLR